MTTVTFRKDPQRGWRMWDIAEIYLGQVGVVTRVLYVPNVRDLVFDPDVDMFFKVVAVDEVTAIPTLVEVDPSKGFSNPITDPDNLMHGLMSYQPHGRHRAFYDDNTSPPTITIDARYRVYGSESHNCKFFKGTDVTDEGMVISQKLDSNNVVVSELVDLDPVHGSYNTIKRPIPFRTTHQLDDGEVITMVVYTATGRKTEVRSFVIRHAGMIAGPVASHIYIEDIELISDLISNSNPLLVENILGSPFQTSLMACRVHYSNGLFADHAIDGNRIELHGINNFNTSIMASPKQLVLAFQPLAGEPAININGVTKPAITKTYYLANKASTVDFALKLYVVPIWDGAKYVLRFRLTNAEYNLDADVTEYVNVALDSGGPFRGDLFGTQQNVNVSLDLDATSMDLYPGHVHVQHFRITLNPPGTQTADDYVLDYSGDGYTYFGIGHFAEASVINDRQFKVDINQTNKDSWLDWLYWALDPAYNNQLMDRAPTPTHFRIEHGGNTGDHVVGTYSVEDWDKIFTLGSDRNWEQGYPLNLVWLVRENGLDKTLAVTPLSIKYIYVPD